MSYRAYKKITLIYFISILFYGCSPNNNIDIDLSNLPKPKAFEINEKVEKDIFNEDNQFLVKDLVPFATREKLLSKFKIGKKNPFSVDETKNNQFSSDFKLTGFLNTDIEQFVFVRYLGKKGAISKDSIGGLNTNLLPNGAKVINIDTKKRQLKINFDNEDFTFEF